MKGEKRERERSKYIGVPARLFEVWGSYIGSQTLEALKVITRSNGPGTR